MTEELGTLLRRAREKRGWTQEELADLLAGLTGEGVSQRTVSSWETGTKRPPYERVVVLAHVLSLSLWELTLAGWPDSARVQREGQVMRLWRLLDEEKRDSMVACLEEKAAG